MPDTDSTTGSPFTIYSLSNTDRTTSSQYTIYSLSDTDSTTCSPDTIYSLPDTDKRSISHIVPISYISRIERIYNISDKKESIKKLCATLYQLKKSRLFQNNYYLFLGHMFRGSKRILQNRNFRKIAWTIFCIFFINLSQSFDIFLIKYSKIFIIHFKVGNCFFYNRVPQGLL